MCAPQERESDFGRRTFVGMVAMASDSQTPSFAELKVQELLREVRVEYPPHETAQAVLSALTSCFCQIPDHQVTSSLLPSFVEDLGVPAEKAKFSFKSPMHMEIIGSYAIQAMAKPNQTMDLAVHIPKSCFHEKDFLNHRYHAKRALYLGVLKSWLKKCSFVKGTKWSSLHHDGRKPILLVQLGDELKVDFKFDISLIPVIGQDVFNVSKLVPSRSNIKLTASEVGSGATPHYNASILEDMDIQFHCHYLKDALALVESSRDAILLLKVWMRQRGFSNMADIVNGFLLSMLLAYLIHTSDRKFLPNMNSVQIFRTFIESIANGLLGKALFLRKERLGRTKEGDKVYSDNFDAVVMSTSESCNIAFRLTKSAVAEIKDAACTTMAGIKNTRDFGFDDIFLTAVEFSAKFDYHVRISMVDQRSKPPLFADEVKCRDVERQVMRILKQGLGNRASLLRVYGRVPSSDWDPKKGVHFMSTLPIYVGILVSDADAANRMVDVGPSADNAEEASFFRAFWGEKAELRRFKDGKITETAVWECESTKRHLIIPNIIRHLLIRHLSLSASLIHVSGEQLDYVFLEGKRDSSAAVPKLLLAFDLLSKRLRGLEDLPLKISSIQPLHSAFRHAAVFTPNANILADERLKENSSQIWMASCVDPLEVVVQLEGSGRWPTNQKAIEKTKLAFCLKMADSMHQTHGIRCVAAEECVDMLMHGFCFRLKLHYNKDPTLVNASAGKNQSTKDLHTEHARGSSPSPVLDKDLLLQSLHASFLGGLHGRYPVYGPTVRLAKRWMGSHLLSDVLREEAIELLVAYIFIHPTPYLPPLSRLTGFLRFLLLLSNYDWDFAPLILDINGDFTAMEYKFITDEFHHVRQEGLAEGAASQQGAMFISTPYDLRSQTWTAFSPNKLMLKRLVSYAKSSAELLSKLIKGESAEQWMSLFCTPLILYDIILKVQPSKLPHPHRVLSLADIKATGKVSVKAPEDGFRPWFRASTIGKSADAQKQLLFGFDPTLLLIKDIKGKFGDMFHYWYDHIGSRVVCLSWKSASNKGAARKRKRTQEDEEIMIELSRLGAGFIESVHVVEHDQDS